MVVSCGVCKVTFGDLKDSIKCAGSCGQSFHFACTPLIKRKPSDEFFDARSWLCTNCTQIRDLEGFVDGVVNQNYLEEVLKKVRSEALQKTAENTRDIREIKESVTVLSRQVDELKKNMSNFEDDIDRLQLESSRLQSKIGYFWRTVLCIENEVNDLQMHRDTKGSQQKPVEEEQEEGKMKLTVLFTLMIGYGMVAVTFLYFFAKYLYEKSEKDNEMDERYMRRQIDAE